MKRVLLLLIVCLLLVSMSACSHESSDISKYGEFKDYSKYSGGPGEYLVFPESIPKSAENVKYYFQHVEGLVDPAIQLYLEYELSEEDYDAEVQRLKNIKGYDSDTDDYTDEKNSIKSDDTNYIFPAYVSINDTFDCSFEYVLMDEEQSRLIYIYMTHIDSKSGIKFDTSYLPERWESSLWSESENSHSIYSDSTF